MVDEEVELMAINDQSQEISLTSKLTCINGAIAT